MDTKRADNANVESRLSETKRTTETQRNKDNSRSRRGTGQDEKKQDKCKTYLELISGSQISDANCFKFDGIILGTLVVM